MIRSLASLLLLLGLLAIPGGTAGEFQPRPGITAEAVLDAAVRAAEPAERPTESDDPPHAALLRQTPDIDHSHSHHAPGAADTVARHRHAAPFRARAPPDWNVAV
jgi:hypothetical protein